MDLIYYEKFLYLFLALLSLLIVSKFKTKKEKSINNRLVVITGGSKGIGLQIAIDCVKRGANVTIIARNVEALEKAIDTLNTYKIMPEQKIHSKSLDISKNYIDVCNALAEIENIVSQPIYMLVSCAGLAICGIIEEVSVEDAKYLMDVNYFGTYYPIHCVLPKMKKRNEGIIVITASQAALLGIYGYGPYAATKFALRGLAETIAMESKHRGISVTLALPCDTDTPGFKNEEKTKPIETKLISEGGGLADPEKVAKQIVKDALRGSFFSVYGFESFIITLLCCGMAPWGDAFLNVLQMLLMGPLRFVGLLLQWNFFRIITRCAKDKLQ